MDKLKNIRTYPLQKIAAIGGDVMHAVKHSDVDFFGFGEAYFSWIKPGAVKAWKRHREMSLNLIVPLGEIRFVFHDTEEKSFKEIFLIGKRYQLFFYGLL